MKDEFDLKEIDFQAVDAAVMPSHEGRFKKFSVGFTKGFQATVSGMGAGGLILMVIAGVAVFTATAAATVLSGAAGAIILGGVGLGIGIYNIWKNDKDNLLIKQSIEDARKELQKELIHVIDDYQKLQKLLKESDEKLKVITESEEGLEEAKKNNEIRREQLIILQKLKIFLSRIKGISPAATLSFVMDNWNLGETMPESINNTMQQHTELSTLNTDNIKEGFHNILGEINNLEKELSKSADFYSNFDTNALTFKTNLNEDLNKRKAIKSKTHFVVDALTQSSVLVGGATLMGGSYLAIGLLVAGSAAALFSAGLVVTIPLIAVMIAGGVGAYLYYKHIKNKQVETKKMLNDSRLQLNSVNQSLKNTHQENEKFFLKNELSEKSENTNKLKQEVGHTHKIALELVEEKYNIIRKKVDKLHLKEIQEKTSMLEKRFKIEKTEILKENKAELQALHVKLEALNKSLSEVAENFKQLGEAKEEIVHLKEEIKSTLGGLETTLININYTEGLIKRKEQANIKEKEIAVLKRDFPPKQEPKENSQKAEEKEEHPKPPTDKPH